MYHSGNSVTFGIDNMAKDGDKASSVTDHLTSTKPWTIGYTYEPEVNSALPTRIPDAAGTDKVGYTKVVEVNGVSY